MIATCLVRQKTSQNIEFDYIIPPTIQNIEPLTLVEVPFLRKKVPAVVLRTKPSSTFAKKEISRRLSLGPVFTKKQLELSQLLANEFLSDQSSALFSFLPKLNIRDLKNMNAQTITRKSTKSKRIFIEAIFSERLQYYIQSIDKDKQNLIVYPEVEQAEIALKQIKKLDPSLKTFIWHSAISSKDKSLIWQALLNQDNCVIVSTRHGLFLPFTQIQNIFLDQPTSFGYFEDQDPRYNAYQASKLLQKIYNCNLYFGDSSPSAEIFAQVKNKKIEYISFKSQLKINNAPQLSLIFSSANFLQDFKKSRKVLIAGFFKEITNITCQECQTKQTCNKCQNEVFSDANNLCLKCLARAPIICQNCQSIKLKGSGLSYSKIRFQVDKAFGLDETSNKPDEKIVIKSMRELNDLNPIFDLAIIPYFELYTLYPFLNFKLELLRLIKELPSYGIKVVYLSSQGENLFATRIENGEFDKILFSELTQRKHEKMPPFTRYLEIDGSKNEKKIIIDFLETNFIDLDSQKSATFLTHPEVKKLQEYFRKHRPNIKVRLDSPDFC